MPSYRDYPGRYLKPPRGMCRWCGLVIKRLDGTVNLRRTFCGPACTTHYLLRADPKRMREHVFFRDKGVCSGCGKVHFYLTGDWEADHIKPLMIALGDPAFWEPDNVTLLCLACHIKKSAEDRRKYRKKDRRRVERLYQKLIDE